MTTDQISIKVAAAAIGAPATALSIVDRETLYWFDGPLSTLTTIDGVLHYGHIVGEASGWGVYVYAPVSETTADAIKADRIPLRDVLTGADRVLVVTYHWLTPDTWTARAVQSADLPQDWLPTPGVRLSVEGTIAAGIPLGN